MVAYIHEHPTFIQPEIRRNEVLGFLRRPLGDLCISRPVERLSWGISLPFDPGYVCYVWFDALLNYLTGASYLADTAGFNRLWPVATHLISKDILTTHAVYWPTMLHAIGLPQPKATVAHGWWVVGGQKLSKSRGPKVQPLDLAAIYGADAFRYFLLRDCCLALMPEVVALVGQLALNHALARVMEVVGEINSYLERTAPWHAVKTDPARTATILCYATEALRLLSVLLYPVPAERMGELWRRPGWTPPAYLEDALSWGGLRRARRF